MLLNYDLKLLINLFEIKFYKTTGGGLWIFFVGVGWALGVRKFWRGGLDPLETMDLI